MSTEKKKKHDKEIKLKILNVVLTSEITKGHLKWKVADISRKLKVSRSLVYYHFGNTKKEILDSCYRLVAEEFYGLSNDFSGLTDFDNKILEKALLKSQKIYLRTPAIVTFYHRWRLEASETQKRILELEEKYQKKLKDAFSNATPDEILALHSMFHGIVSAPFVNLASVKIVLGLIENFLATIAKRKT